MVEVVVAADAGRTEGAESAGEQRELGARGREKRGWLEVGPTGWGLGESPQGWGLWGEIWVST